MILDAINRSQRERAAPGEVPGVATVHYAGATAAPSAWRQGLLGLLLVIAVGVIAWLLWRPAPVAERALPAAAPPQRAAPTPSADFPAQPVATPSPRAVEPEVKGEGPVPAVNGAGSRPAVAPEVAALYAEPASPQSAAGAQTAPAAARREPGSQGKVSAEKAAVERASVERAAQATAPEPAVPEPAVPEPAVPEEQALDVEALLRAAQREMGGEELSEHPAPFLSELSQQRKDAIPTLLYSAHDYRGGGWNSTVLINGKTARAGQALGKGVTVVEILPDSVVLEFAGKPFRLRALNSWVNL
nr:general secretion pathway protein GspB [Parahaliea mediterranea]